MAFWPTYKDNWTRTPNVFFDVILKDPTTTLNQVRLVGHLIRQTIGYNREGKWAAVSRSDLIQNAGIPNGRIKDAIAGCEKKKWILVYEHGEGTKKERYIFLNDERNVRIVEGLKKGCFTIDDLQYLNLAGIDKLLEKHGIPITYTETVEEQKFSYTETVEATYTETVEGDKAKEQAGQGVSEPLKTTSFKDSSFKDVVVVELFRKYMNVEITEEEAQLVINESISHQKDIEKAIQETVEWAEINEKELTNPVGSVIYAIQKGWNLSRQTYRPKKKSAKQDQRKAERKPADKEKLPEALRMAQEQPQQPPAEDEDMEEKQRQIQEKLKEMNERFNQRKERKPEYSY